MHSLKIHFRLLVAFTAVAASAQTIEHEKDREHWERVAEMFKAMQVHAGSVVADVGAGDGFLTVRLSPAVGDVGSVYAGDIDEKRLERLRRRLGDAHLNNVVIVPLSIVPNCPRDGQRHPCSSSRHWYSMIKRT